MLVAESVDHPRSIKQNAGAFGRTVIVGDNLRTDILAGFQAGLETILVLSGVSSLDDIDSMPFRPSWIYPSVAEIDVI